MAKKDTRVRNWTFVLYPESAPDNWRDLIDELHVPWIESPLHDKDLNADGTPKKAHWHILLIFKGKKSFEQIKSITDALSAPIPQPCDDTTGLVRYFAHLDNPEKYQYSRSDIVGHCGANVGDLVRASSAERYQFIDDMMEFIKSNHITEFQDLADYARYNEPDTWFPLLCDNSAFIVNQYIKSQRHRYAASAGVIDE